MDPEPDDGTLAVAVGATDVLLQARKTIRELAASPEWTMFEEHLHAIRIATVALAAGRGYCDELLRENLERGWIMEELSEAIERTNYLDQPCSVLAKRDVSGTAGD